MAPRRVCGQPREIRGRTPVVPVCNNALNMTIWDMHALNVWWYGIQYTDTVVGQRGVGASERSIGLWSVG